MAEAVEETIQLKQELRQLEQENIESRQQVDKKKNKSVDYDNNTGIVMFLFHFFMTEVGDVLTKFPDDLFEVNIERLWKFYNANKKHILMYAKKGDVKKQTIIGYLRRAVNDEMLVKVGEKYKFVHSPLKFRCANTDEDCYLCEGCHVKKRQELNDSIPLKRDYRRENLKLIDPFIRQTIQTDIRDYFEASL